MQHLMAFGDSDLDRAAHRRSNEQVRQVLPLHQGRILAADGRLALREADDPLLANAGSPIFLGLHDGRAVHARAITGDEPTLPAGTEFAELRAMMTTLSAAEGEMAATARALLNWHASHKFCAACGNASQMTDGGWRRTCPECGTHHFPRTDPVVIMLILRGNEALIGRSPAWREGFYSCLAGFVEPGETLEAAVRREVLEETAIPVGKVRYLQSQPWPFPSSLMMGCVGYATAGEITVDPVEIAHAFWISREQAMAAIAGHLPNIEMPAQGTIARDLIMRWIADDLE
ncbi:NAD(+) diphosphatase [Falsirhodobacter sp. alg1]|uniref:NAD(+) diphosphatase n=1 Tax=Falsirhodobacter sp. alg1 TaxID=1472418 RepID=UPI0005EE1A53|nr:NAD(+) diphosphatase [Falsirhodobacter sp. alg1]